MIHPIIELKKSWKEITVWPEEPVRQQQSFKKSNRVYPDPNLLENSKRLTDELNKIDHQSPLVKQPSGSQVVAEGASISFNNNGELTEQCLPHHPPIPLVIEEDPTLEITATTTTLKRKLTKIQQIMQFLQEIRFYCLRIARSIYKYVLHFMTGDCELIRICSENDRRHTYMMTIKFTQCLKQSHHLETISRLIKFPKLFIVNDILVEILTKKQIKSKSPVIIANMKTCLQSIRLVNKLCIECQTMRTIAFDYNQMEHVQLLENLWCNLKPGVARSSNRLSEEWGDLGFQGKDPSTDFRGMGMFSLQQLVYFSEKYPLAAQKILADSLIESRYFPFAAVGINITAFVIELLHGLHMHRYIFQHMDKIMLQDVTNSDDGPSEDKNCVALATSLVHELYCKVFIEFGKVWVKQSPQDVMSFPSIFATFKKQIKIEYEGI